jgi:Amidohydrolase family
MHLALRTLLLSCALALPAGTAISAETRYDYSVVIQQQTAGHLNVTLGDERSVQTDLSYRDNGRGPDIRERFVLGAQGAPVEYEGEGVSTYGAQIREQFKVEDGRLRWRSRVDAGDEAVEPGTLFLPIEGTVAYQGEMVRSLLRRPDGRAPIVGGGQLSVERVATMSVDGPQGAVPLVLVALTGADTSPWYSWHRDDDTLRLFAVTWPGFAIVAKGHEDAVDALTARAAQAEDEWLVALQKRTARPLPGLTLIRGVRWFDAPAATMRGPSDVYLRAGRIADVTAPGQLAAQPDHVIDGHGRTLLPGLWDMHAHLWAGAAPLHLVAGVTSVRDMAGDNAYLMRLQARLAAGELPGPTVYLAGFIEGRSPYSSRNGFVVDTVDEGRRAIDWYAARGYRQIKLYNSIRPEWVRPLAAHAKARGLKVSGHVPAFMLAAQAVNAGYDELTHINQVTLNFVTQPGDDPRTLLRFTRIGDDAHRLDVNSPRVRAFLALLVRHGTVVDPTLATFESMFTQQQGQPKPGLVALADHLPAVWRRSLRAAEMDLEGTQLTTYRASYARMLALTLAMHRAGVPLVAGTDDIPGLTLHRELELYVQAGIPAPHALRIATWNGARVAGAEQEAGSIARGKVADLMLIDGDPSRRIADIRRASLVLKGGVAYAPAQLFEAMGFKPVVDGARIETRPNAP